MCRYSSLVLQQTIRWLHSPFIAGRTKVGGPASYVVSKWKLRCYWHRVSSHKFKAIRQRGATHDGIGDWQSTWPEGICNHIIRKSFASLFLSEDEARKWCFLKKPFVPGWWPEGNDEESRDAQGIPDAIDALWYQRRDDSGLSVHFEFDPLNTLPVTDWRWHQNNVSAQAHYVDYDRNRRGESTEGCALSPIQKK